MDSTMPVMHKGTTVKVWGAFMACDDQFNSARFEVAMPLL